MAPNNSPLTPEHRQKLSDSVRRFYSQRKADINEMQIKIAEQDALIVALEKKLGETQK